MSISAIFGIRVTPSPLLSRPQLGCSGGDGGMAGIMIECSSRPQKKSTAHHRKTRPKKTQPWDIKRGPTVYSPRQPLPPDWTLVSAAAVEAEAESEPVAPAVEAPAE